MGGEKMKKQCMVFGVFLTGMLLAVATVFAGYYFGPGNAFYMEASTGTSVRGLWVEGTMSAANVDGYLYSKRVYARSGAEGTYSAWHEPSIRSVTHRDYGSFTNDYAEVRGEWK